MDPTDWLYGLIQNLWDYLVELVQWLWDTIVYVAENLWELIKAIPGALWGLLKDVGKLFRVLWDGFFKKIWTAVLHAIQKAHAWLEMKLGPLIRFLKSVRAWYDRWFRTYIKPLLTFLQRIRRIIKILDFLHIHVLDGLDKIIGKIEQKITQAILTIRGILNNLIDLVNIVADPMLILRRPTLVYSFRRVFLSLFRVFTGLPPGYFVPSPKASAKKGLGFLPNGFDPGDPSQNPPASSYLGNDGLPSGFSGFLQGDIPDDSTVNDLEMLDFFNDDLWPDPLCTDPLQCWQDTVNQVLQVGSNG